MPTRAHRDPLPARVGDEVPHDEEVPGEAHLGDDGQLVAETLDHGVRRRAAVATGQALRGEVLEVGVEGVAGGDVVVRQVELPEAELELAALRHGQRVAVGLGQVLEDGPHLVRRLEVELLRGEPPPVGIAHGRARLDAQERLVGPGVAGLDVVRVVGAAEGRPDLPRQAHGRLGHPRLEVYPVRLDFHEVEVLAEDLPVPPRHLESLGVLPGREQLAHLRVEASREDEEPVGMLGQQLVIDARLVVEALQVRLRDELDQVAVARLVADEDGSVARALVAAVLGRALEAAARGHVELAADDRRDGGLLAGRVEVDGAEEVAVIGEGEGREAELGGPRDEPHVHFFPALAGRALDLLELSGAVQQAVLRVDVEVDEVGAGGAALAGGAVYSHSMVLGGLEEMS